jgi:hypothetical protein
MNSAAWKGAFAIVAALAGIAPGHAQDPAAERALFLELNGAQPSDKGCRLTFLVKNELGPDLSEAGFEIALFDEQGVVSTLAVLGFQDLPAGKTKVTRFDLSGVDCTKLSRVLVNHATQCTGTGVEPATCMRSLKTATRTKIEFGA